MGVKSEDVAYTDIYGLDPELLAMVPRPVLAVLLLFPINEAEEAFKDQQNARIEAGTQPKPENVFIMRQTIGNACGTIGLVHSIGNNLDSIELGTNDEGGGTGAAGARPRHRRRVLVFMPPFTPDTNTEEGSYLDKFFKEAKGKGRVEVGEIMERATDISVAHEEAANEGQTQVRVGLERSQGGGK